MAIIYISIGSNIDAKHHIRLAVDALRKHYKDLILSSVYESEAVGFKGDNFLNMVVSLKTEEDINTVASVLHHIEDQHGRVRSGPRFSARTLDLDLLLYDDLIYNVAGLQIPRDEITKNAFVLWPMAEIAPETKHPQLNQTMSELWQAYDKNSQKLWPVELNNL
ncbi:MAG: 2-amino-4-hydroxy-6-hydroxymethyldihydropteridine diphosphokinase [Gammaproteobacteria bacterium]|nr:2-amino-4-hydroxy-6-hydroxymethyldihydropteridine diphosphokinase [Gammaproteobacteria bacterium]